MNETMVARVMKTLSRFYKARRMLLQRPSSAARALQASKLAYYDEVWREAAERLGAPISEVADHVLDIEIGGQRLRVSGTTTSLDDPVTLRVAGDKPLVHRLLAERGVPVPRHVDTPAWDLASAWAFVEGTSRQVVVKPARDTGAGNGVTTGLTSRIELARAMALAGTYCDDVVVESFVAGDNYRLLYLDGALLSAVERVPPCLKGDGETTLNRLVEKENRSRLEGGIQMSQSLIAVDDDLRRALRQQGYSLRSVPPAGVLVRLKGAVSDNRSNDNRVAGHLLSDAVVEAGATAVRAVGARLAAVDLITPDPSLPLEDAGGAVIEVNTTPGLYYHSPDSGASSVSRDILERLAQAQAGGNDADLADHVTG